MAQPSKSDTALLRSIFAGRDKERVREVIDNGRKLIHYTSAANALNIFRERKMWMRNVRVMNDLSEVSHGVSMVMSTLQSLKLPSVTPIETGLAAVVRELGAIFPALPEQGNETFLGWRYSIEYQSYVACLSEHLPEEEGIGRLSMWRNYTGQQIGVGIVIDPKPFQNEFDDYGAFTSPVHYLDERGVNVMLQEVAEEIRINAQLLQQIDRPYVLAYYFALLRWLCLATKHPGFREEREWRIIHTGVLDQTTGLTAATVTPGGVPQRIMQLEFANDSERGITGISLPELIDHVIIGPCQTPLIVGEAIAAELEAIGVTDIETRIRYSNIPIRT